MKYLIMVGVLSAAAIIDIKEYRIPDRLVLAGAAAGLAFSLSDPGHGLLYSLGGGLTALFIMLPVHYLSKGGLGPGDVKLFGCAGIYLGIGGIVSAIAAASLLSGLYGLILICISRQNKNREIPFAPFILAGALAAVLL